MTTKPHTFMAKLTGYFPPPEGGYATKEEEEMEGGAYDRIGKPLCTLQEFLRGEAPYVSVAMDFRVFPYGTKLTIPALEEKYGKPIIFRVVDTGGAFRGQGTSRIDICVENKRASWDRAINRLVEVRSEIEPKVN